MVYEDVKALVCAKFTVEDGYNGSLAHGGLAWIDGEAYEVFDCGYMHSPRLMGKFKTASDMIEAAKKSSYFMAVQAL